MNPMFHDDKLDALQCILSAFDVPLQEVGAIENRPIAERECVRHGENVTAGIDGIGGPGWKRVELADYLPEQDISFYRNLTEAIHA